MAPRAKVLLVDDRPDNLVALEAILSSLDLDVVRAECGEEALKALLGNEFALILLDVVMPGMDGFETATHIKSRDKTREVPIIFLTADGSVPSRAFRGYAAGAVDYLTKPFDPWVLRTKVSVFVDLFRKSQQLRAQAELLRDALAEDQPAGAPPLAELTSHLAAIEDQIQLLRTKADQLPADQLDQLTDRVQGLRDVLHSFKA